MTTLFKKQVAARENVKLKVGITGPSGSGKTFSALQLAYGIAGDWKKIAVADTENKSAAYYAALGPWEHIPFDPDDVPGGYHPDNWVKLIKFAESDPAIEVLILDSISHEWEGKGGCLEIQSKMGGKYQDWAKITPMHNAFVDAMRLSRLHIIGCMRSKQDYAMEQNDKGKVTVRKVGMKSIQREGLDYEFGLVFDIEINHFATATKDRTGVFGNRTFQIAPEIGKELIAWASTGAVPAPKQVDGGFDVKNDDHLDRLEKILTGQFPDLKKDLYDLVAIDMNGKPMNKSEVQKSVNSVIIAAQVFP